MEVRVDAPAPGPATASTPGPATTPEPAQTAGSRRLLRIAAARLVDRRRSLAVRLGCAPAAATGCGGTVVARLAGRRIGRRGYAGVAPGRSRTIRVRLRRGARLRSGRRLVVTATVRDAAGAARTARRAFRVAALR